ncbi:hypothetical protein [Leucobacter aridicollis]|uniref:Uncharacterized protein n=1 Tax=Leucobacter aridicollis TaxID=283878 RepID=A0A852R6J6_9MICO|nr:hypothetical protein [Leucobacter aridicollis]NYD26069.1 hypothetical protein [Leucobacter aridicollis]
MATTEQILARSLNDVRDELSLFMQDVSDAPAGNRVFQARVQRILESLTEAVEALADDSAGRANEDA